jgi:anthranilate synthase component 1
LILREVPVLRPSSEKFCELARSGNLIPVVREIMADTETPVSLFQRLDDGRTSFLFESVEGGEKWGRFSFIGVGARAIFRAAEGTVTWTSDGRTEREEIAGDPLDALRRRLAEMRPVTLPGEPLPRFAGGAVGAIAWDWVRFVEKIPDTNPDELDFPDAWFVLPETVVVYDNVKHRALVIRDVLLREGDVPEDRYAAAVEAIDAIVRKIREPRPQERFGPAAVPMDVTKSETRDSYCEMVQAAKRYIEAGDIFQVVLSQRFRVPLQADPFLMYRQLRKINPSPYLFFLRCDGPILIGSSPEILVRLEDSRVHVRPIAGTRPRGGDSERDLELERELRADPKELAEHLMLVDLGRNDVGRVAVTGSVEVAEFAVVERYSHVMHLVSNVEGELREGTDWLDLLRATFPAGTLSGAPKVRAMEIIDELEHLRRGPYGGCVGYIGYSGNMDMAIAIRTMLVQDGNIYLQAGGGVVADSKPEAEYQESENKARALIQAIDLAREGLD